ncbi:hypothetical protein KSB_61260 [Ktedonobacter robiniae]|uniref:Uncharacterized protein n=1 Tax=Ktedonobacter robiniae TaxID=2778365 RepID=A0ABQ3UXP3_9CHLR|nr:hypothetical protein KSB_61260 [Ktedonobacter robiniae]
MKSRFAKGCFLAFLIILWLTGCGGTGQTERTTSSNILHASGTGQTEETTGLNVLYVFRTNPLPIPGVHHLPPLNRVIATQHKYKVFMMLLML